MTAIGPSLRRIGAKVDPRWLVRWITNPHEFRPRTRMPNFMFTEEQADDDRRVPARPTTKQPSEEWLDGHPAPGRSPTTRDAGRSRARSWSTALGCRACHALAPDEVAGPARRQQGHRAQPVAASPRRPDARWIYHWIKNPRGYSDVARMPSLRLTDDEARAITAYLTDARRRSTPAPDGLDDRLAESGEHRRRREAGAQVRLRRLPRHPRHGERVAHRRRAVDLRLEDEGGALLRRPHRHRARPGTTGRTTSSRRRATYATEVDRAADAAVRPRRRGHQRAARLPHQPDRARRCRSSLHATRDIGQREIVDGRRLVARYNCIGCHIIEGTRRRHPAPLRGQPDAGAADPARRGREGAGRLALRLPEGAGAASGRGCKVRMPTFGLTTQEADDGRRSTSRRSTRRGARSCTSSAPMLRPRLRRGRQAARVEGLLRLLLVPRSTATRSRRDRRRAGPRTWRWRATRLNPDWIVNWLHDPQKLMPGTKMPSFYSRPPDGPPDILGGNDEEQMRALRDYIISLGLPPAQRAAPCGRPPAWSPTAPARSSSIEPHDPHRGKGGTNDEEQDPGHRVRARRTGGRESRDARAGLRGDRRSPTAASLSGTVKFDGTPPAPKKIEVTKDQEVCGKETGRRPRSCAGRRLGRRHPGRRRGREGDEGQGARGADRARHVRPEGLRVQARTCSRSRPGAPSRS